MATRSRLHCLFAHVLVFAFLADPLALAQLQVGADPRTVALRGGTAVPAPAAESSESTACAENLGQRLAPLVSLVKTMLWPPDHPLVDVGLGVNVTAPCEGRVTTRVAVYADEPDEDQTGDGNVPGDAKIDGTTLYLR